MTKDVNYYYDKFMHHFEINDTAQHHDFNELEGPIREAFQKMIDKGIDYLLTDSFLNFFAEYSGLIDEEILVLDDLSNHKTISLFDMYFEKIYSNYNRSSTDYKDGFATYVNLLDEKTKEATKIAYDSIEYLYNTYGAPAINTNMWTARAAVMLCLRNCFFQNRLSDFPSMCEFIKNNPIYLIDDLKVNGLYQSLSYEMEAEERLFNVIDNHVKQSKPVNIIR